MSDWTNSHPGQHELAVGDVVDRGGEPYIVTRVGDCNAMIEGLARRQVKVNTRFGGTKEFDAPGRPLAVAHFTDPSSVVERRGEQGLKDYLASDVPRRRKAEVAQQQQTGAQAPQQAKDEDMARQRTLKGEKKTRKARGGLAAEKAADEAIENGKQTAKEMKKAAQVQAKADKAKAKAEKKAAKGNGKASGLRTKGSLGEICGFAVTAVLRCLGKNGVTPEEATAILKAKKITMPPKSLYVQVAYGRSGGRPPAPLTGDQVSELKKLAA